jgi:cytochrome c6
MKRRLAAALLWAAGACAAAATWIVPAAAAPFAADEIDKGRERYHRTCAQCHGHNMVNSGTTTYDLRRFPVDDPERFTTSVTNGKGNMPSFKDALTPEQIGTLWAYVGSRGGKEP